MEFIGVKLANEIVWVSGVPLTCTLWCSHCSPVGMYSAFLSEAETLQTEGPGLAANSLREGTRLPRMSLGVALRPWLCTDWSPGLNCATLSHPHAEALPSQDPKVAVLGGCVKR